MSKVTFAGRKISVPGNRLLRVILGIALICGGLLGFLPVLGFWMIPLGMAILAIDSPTTRRFYRRLTIRFGYWLQRRWPRLARHFGYGTPRNGKH